MSTGKPVTAVNLCSIPEIIVQGQAGFVCQNYEEMAAMIPTALKLNRHNCKEYVAKKLSVNRMVDGYTAVYKQLIKNRINLGGYVDAVGIQL
jgi:glycosyltransferase involved in cell wall biosynthesis